MKTLLEIESEIKYHNKKYWDEQSPEISDDEYDLLVQELKILDPTNELIYSPNTQPNLLSLDKVYSIHELIEKLENICRSKKEILSVQPKLDGIAGCYLNKRLITKNSDCSDKLKNINFITDNKLLLYGELIFKKSTYKSLNLNYKTRRNGVAGLLNQKEELPDNIKIDFVDYDKFEYLCSLEELKQFLNENNSLEEIFEDLDYDMDGIVVKIKDKEYYDSLGSTSHHPKGAIAYKFANKRKIAKIENVIFSSGMKTISPIAIITPTELNGVTIQKVSLHNAKYLLDNNIKINDFIEIERTGDATPTVTKVIKNPNENELKEIIIETCPNCGCELIYREPFLYCSNKDCIGMLTNNIDTGLKRLGVKNIGSSIVNKIIDKFEITDISQLFDLTVSDFMKLEGFQFKSAKNCFTELQNIANSPIEEHRLLSCLCIDGLGETLCKQICQNIPLNDLLNSNFNKLFQIHGIGEIRYYSIIQSINDKIETLNNLIKIFKNIISSKDKPKICFTGKMPEARSYYSNIAKEKGYDVVNTVTSDLSLLVISEANHQSKKVEIAKKNNVKIVVIDEFLQQ